VANRLVVWLCVSRICGCKGEADPAAEHGSGSELDREWRNRVRNPRTTLCSLLALAMAVMACSVARVTPSALTR
jgi:hypothetical protein